ncbi:glutamate--cysteine ligase [Rubrobacter tropicus]|uniref:glutamate--cysteine ligase n=1 Tax=Rubrobacter tropicus TaxID=2653851 RepID=UPI001407226D|nr:glutamate--cysteine ligase [Rubrobacter tropicus]
MPVRFNASEKRLVGIEEELQIIDPATGGLAPKVEKIMSSLQPELEGAVARELFQSMVEIRTPPCASVGEAAASLRERRRRLGTLSAARGVALASAGTHPFSHYEDQEITDRERYRKMVRVLRWVAEREVCFGQHVHVGVRDEEEAIEAHNRLSESSPLLLALSANSPYRHGRDTGYESTRVKIFETLPRSGIPPTFADYEAFEGYVDLMVEMEAMDDYTYCWWDVRPHPNIGTIELRILDSQTDYRYAGALAALTHCLVVEACSESPKGPFDREIVTENKWRGSRLGLDATIYDRRTRDSLPARAAAVALVERLRPVSQTLGCEDELLGILEIVERGTGSQHQRRAYQRKGDFRDVVSYLVEGTHSVEPTAAHDARGRSGGGRPSA